MFNSFGSIEDGAFTPFNGTIPFNVFSITSPDCGVGELSSNWCCPCPLFSIYMNTYWHEERAKWPALLEVCLCKQLNISSNKFNWNCPPRKIHNIFLRVKLHFSTFVWQWLFLWSWNFGKIFSSNLRRPSGHEFLINFQVTYYY